MPPVWLPFSADDPVAAFIIVGFQSEGDDWIIQSVDWVNHDPAERKAILSEVAADPKVKHQADLEMLNHCVQTLLARWDEKYGPNAKQ